MNRKEYDDAYKVGTDRHDRRRAANTREKFVSGKPETDRHRDGLGAAAEALVAESLGMDWDRGLHPDDGTDVGGIYGVRHRRWVRGELIIRPRDRDDVIQILVVGDDWPLRIVGWLRGGDGKLPIYYRDGSYGPAYFVPQSKLHPMSELVRRRK